MHYRVLVAAGFLCPMAVAGTIEKAVLFPTADTLRVQVTLASPKTESAVEVKAHIQAMNNGPTLWQGTLGRVDLSAGRPVTLERTIQGLKPELWSPGSPTLYDVHLTVGDGKGEASRLTQRTGFRTVESRDGQILLNGKPIFLRGLAINPPGRGVPDAVAFTREFARDYVRFMRSKNFNCIRMNFEFVVDPRTQHWFDACDEFGMLVYQGCYGAPPTGQKSRGSTKDEPPQDIDASVAAYREVFETYARHPAVIIYILSNELPYQGRRGETWHAFLTEACARLKQWDATRLYIGNAGYGEGKQGDINDVHRYWGWYYNSFLTYYNLRRAHEIFGEPGAIQPFTFSECVGSFTSTLGEFNLTFRKQLGAQLHWTGHSSSQAADALAYQAFMAQRACESFRTLREVNPRLAGLMPFTILFYHWDGISRFEQMQAKPVADTMATAYQPVLLAWELWQTQVYAGTTIEPWAHVINDAEDYSTLQTARLEARLVSADGRPRASATETLPAVPYFGHAKRRLSLRIPDDLPTGDYRLTGTLTVGDTVVSRNETSVFVAGREWRDALKEGLPANCYLYDPQGATARALRKLGVPTRSVRDLAKLPPGASLIVGEQAADGLDLSTFVRAGGRVLLLGQDAKRFRPDWLPARIQMLAGTANSPEYYPKHRPTRDQMYVNVERPDHPVFAGLDRTRFRIWSDYTDWDQTKSGFPAIYPVTRGFKLTRAEDLARVAVLANYDRGLEGVALCEMFDGQGSVVMTSFDLVARAGLDPVADRLLCNLVSYLAADEHPLHPLITEPIQWGRYGTEKGVITGPLNGLVVNCRWVRPPTDPNAKPMRDNEGAWNILPGHQYVAIGRRPYGPYTYNTGTSTREENPNSPVGSGFFHASLPPGKRVMITVAENPSSRDANLEIQVNGRKQSFTIPAGKTLPLSCDLAGQTRSVEVRYRGDKSVVLLETRFE
ncbi:MAG TPA: glycoside hydrolase family 2 TIM barrel-domain containing protein [Phycisphaerae bacterium]|nr:glycoside hydrolase family 2 TIM barrel-domain containing protein [Phycisphaerae bacterium]